MKHNYLMTPGPSPLLPEVKSVLGKDIIHHRTDEFRGILKEVHENLQYLFQTKGPVLIFTSSGTGAMEAGVSNFLKKGDKALVIIGGKFGGRWKEICESFGVKTVALNLDWGNAPLAEDVEKLLDADSAVKAVYTTLCETSTASVYDIRSIAEVTRKKGVLCVVDAVSGLGQDVLKTDEWGVDVVVSGSQKGLMLPPGLAFISFSKKAEKFLEESDLPKYYFDLKKAFKAWEKNDTPFTSAIPLVQGFHEALKMVNEEGIENRIKRTKNMAEATRAALDALNLELFPDRKYASDTLTAINYPEGITDKDFRGILKEKYGVVIAGGQEHIKGKIFRIGHMGQVRMVELLGTFGAIEAALRQLGYTDFTPGAGVAAIEEYM